MSCGYDVIVITAARRAGTAPARSHRAGYASHSSSTSWSATNPETALWPERVIAQARQHRSESRRHSSMNTNKLLVAAFLATSMGAPISGLAGDTKVPQPIISTEIQAPFLHGLLSGQSGSQTELASLDRADEWLNSPPLTAPALRGKVVLIDFWTYTCINWLRTASLCPRVGREIQGSRIGSDRRPCAGVHF